MIKPKPINFKCSECGYNRIVKIKSDCLTFMDLVNLNDICPKCHNKMDKIETNNIYAVISNLLHKARGQVKSAVNITMVRTYFEIGRIIVEEEQNGEERADYGKQLIKKLSIKLTSEFGKGFSKRNLDNMKKFYLAYSIVQNRSAQFKLGFSQYSMILHLKMS